MEFEQYKTEIEKLAKKHKLEFVALFGSQARGNTHSKSDIDVAVISREKFDFFQIVGEFYDIFRRDDVEVVDLSSASPTMMMAVIENHKLLYEQEEGIFVNWVSYAAKIWMETSWLRELRRKALHEWAAQK